MDVDASVKLDRLAREAIADEEAFEDITNDEGNVRLGKK